MDSHAYHVQQRLLYASHEPQMGSKRMGRTVSICGCWIRKIDDASHVREISDGTLILSLLRDTCLSLSFPVLLSDLVLLQDKKFAKWVAVYAKDGEKFNQDFTAAFQKLEELGTSGLTPTEWA